MVATGIIEVRNMTTNPTPAQITAHNTKVIAKTVAMHIWKKTSRMSTPTRYSTWNR